MLTNLIDDLWKAAEAARAVGAGGQSSGEKKSGIGGFLRDLLGLVLPSTIGAQHGAYVRRPQLVLAGEGGQAEVISPVPMMRQIVREELAAAVGAGAFGVQVNINEIKSYGAADVLEDVRSGTLKQVLEEAVSRRIIDLGGR